jgi:SH3-like domain-containing protein
MAGPSGAAPDFTADFQSNPQNPVNLRSEPGTNGTQIVEILEPGTPLQSMGQEEEVNGVVWRQFRTADGQVGWIREIDAESLDG